MTGRRSLWPVALAVLVVTGGCVLPGEPPEIISFSVGTHVTDEGFRMGGSIVNEGQGEPTRFTDVRIYLYTANGTLLHTEAVGTLERRRNVSIETERVPEYIIVTAPGFWEHPNIDVEYLELRDESEGIYSVKGVDSRDEFPVVLPEDDEEWP